MPNLIVSRSAFPRNVLPRTPRHTRLVNPAGPHHALRRELRRRGLTVLELARALKLGPQPIYSALSGVRPPSPAVRERTAGYFGADLWDGGPSPAAEADDATAYSLRSWQSILRNHPGPWPRRVSKAFDAWCDAAKAEAAARAAVARLAFQLDKGARS